ncbi:glycerophosphodiester phosphodiesterase family protein [Cohnella cellulosilytica]|uniref:Glycerophosphodiester phosphodiesterase family protein n=1 Tax=Cohnella cellulosilytica TaxID=986710 RepID=A0ABW2FJQ8_9BACL
MLRLIIRSLRDFRAFSAKLLFFEMGYMLATSAVVIPMITFVFNRILRVVGSGSLLNGEVYRIGWSYEGLTGLLLIGLVASFALLIELFVLIVLIQQRYLGKQIAIVDALLIALRKTPRLLGFGIFQLMLLLLLLIPFIDSPLSASFYALFNVPIFLNHYVLEASYTMTAAYAALLAVVLYTFLRWIFVLHLIVIEDMRLGQAIVRSHVLTRGKWLGLFGSLLLLNAAVLAATSAALSAIGSIPAWLNMDVLALVSQHHSLTLSTVLTYLLAHLLLPINIFLLTRLYYGLNRGTGIKERERLKILRPSRLGRLENRIWVGWKRLRRKRLIIVSAAVVYVALSLFIGLRANDSLVYAKWSVSIAAHRGDTLDAPENSLLSVISAIDKGIQIAEIDVQLTKDGVAVLNHDNDLRRVTGVRTRVDELTYAELLRLSIGEGEDGKPIRVPALADVLAGAQGRIQLLLDLKPHGRGEALAEEVVRLVQEVGSEQEVRIQSFDGDTLRRVRELAPEIKIGRILFFAFGDLSAQDVDFYTIEQVMLTKPFVKRAHAAGREVWVWTVNASRDMKEVLKFEIDGMITDQPETALSMVEVNL